MREGAYEDLVPSSTVTVAQVTRGLAAAVDELVDLEAEQARDGRGLHLQSTELSAVVDLSFGAARHVALELPGGLSEVPLKVQARYQREEILAALDFPQNPNSFQEGVWYSQAVNVDAFFVTLNKSESDYSPTTMYADYPISPELFHWESQSTTSADSPTGRHYLSGSSVVLIFARHEQKDEFGTSPYLCLGPAHYVSHTGDRPIAITWRLERPLPVDFFAVASAIAQ